MTEFSELINILGLEFDEDGNFVIRIFEDEDDMDDITKILGFGVLNELLQYQIDRENFEGAEILRTVIKRKHEIQEIQRNRK